MKLLRENLLQAGEAGQAVFLLKLRLALDERKRVLGKVFGDVVALGGYPLLGNFFSKLATSLRLNSFARQT